jgi:hypothetical protein
MTQVIHKVTLSSEQPYGKRLPPHQLGLFLAELTKAVRFAVSMAMRSRSTQKGKRPGWLNRAADIRLVEMHGDRETGVSARRVTAARSGSAERAVAPPLAARTSLHRLTAGRSAASPCRAARR